MKTIQARVTRNVKEDPSIQECDLWNVETVLLERLPDEEVRLIADPREIGVEQIPGSTLDLTRTVLTIRTRGRSPLREGDTIQVGVQGVSSPHISPGVSYYDVRVNIPSKAVLVVGVANVGIHQIPAKGSLLLARVANLASAALHNPNLGEHHIASIEKHDRETALPRRNPEYTALNGVEQVWIEKTHF